MIGTLPPIKGVSDYCLELTKAMSKTTEIEFITFKQIYPEFLYPGGTRDLDKQFVAPESPNLHIRELLTYYNPLTWLWAGLTAKGRIVHIQWWTTVLSPIFFTIMLILRLRHKVIILAVHNVLGHETNRIDRLISRIIFSFPNVFILHTTNNMAQMREYFGISDERMVHIPHGIYDFYNDREISKSDARKQLGIADDAQVILCFGNIREYKGIDVMLDAFLKLRKTMPRAYLVIAGKCWIDWKPHEAFIREHHLEKSVMNFLDFVPMSDVKLYFQVADVVALPYKEFEAQSGPGNIALAFAKPMVVSAVGGLPDLVKDKKCVVPSNDSTALAESIARVLSDEKLAAKLSKDSKALCTDYSWEGIAKKTLALYARFS